MHEVWGIAALWLGLALVATLISIWLKIATALSEIIVGTVAQLLIGALIGTTLGSDEPWIKFLSGTGAIVLTFLAGAELDPVVFRAKWKEATAIGFISFLAPFTIKTVIFIVVSIVVGHPADKDCDMIIIGQRGKSRIQTWLLGSVSKRVTSHAPCTVVIVK
jgi:Kef-type K+ transport system membrane component KefB